MKLTDYTWEAFDMAKHNNVDVGVGRDMLIANLEKGAPIEGQPWYGGADNLDYRALCALWQKLSPEQKAAQKNAYSAVTSMKAKHYQKLIDARRNGDKATFKKIVADVVAQ